MKVTTVIMTAVLALQMNVLFAGNRNSYDAPVTTKNSSNSLASLAPATPMEADFNYADINLDFDIKALAPTTPAEADFNDMQSEMEPVLNLAPVTPTVADFEDYIDTITLDLTSLAPTTKGQADFD